MGKTLHSNIELIKNNAILGAKVAKALNCLKTLRSLKWVKFFKNYDAIF